MDSASTGDKGGIVMRERFIFDRTHLEFRKVTRSAGYFILKGLKYFLITASLAVVYYIVFAHFIDTDTEKQLRKQNQMYREMYSGMLEKEELVGKVIAGMHGKEDEVYRRLFNASVPDVAGPGTDIMLADEDSVWDKDLVDYSSKKLDALSVSAVRTEENFRKVMEALSSGADGLPPMSSPLESFAYTRTGATVGRRINPFYKVSVEHDGLDMIAQQGTPVLASASGIVSNVTRSSKGLGNVVEVRHQGGYLTRYAHLDDIRVSQGQQVSVGTLLGHVGVSGNSFAPHLHYEIRKDSVRLDPVHHFFASADPEDYMEMLFMSANAGQSMD